MAVMFVHNAETNVATIPFYRKFMLKTIQLSVPNPETESAAPAQSVSPLTTLMARNSEAEFSNICECAI
jgi:hypothetical protein